jgi:hypothetical protein
MKLTGLLLLISICLVACKSKDDSEQPEVAVEPTETENLVLQMQGDYELCIASPHGPDYVGYYTGLQVTVSGNIMSTVETLSANADCSSPYYEFETVVEISQAARITTTPLKVSANLKIQSYKFTDFHGWYSTQNYCGLTDWTINVTKDVTGLDCPDLNMSSFSTTFLAAGAYSYESLILGSNSLDVVLVENESGFDESSRMLTGLYSIPKI